MLEKLNQSHTRILVIGDLMIDSYLWGNSERISPEAPVQIIDVNSNTLTLGGAGNVVKNLNALNVNVSILSVIGDCEHSKDLLKLLNEISVETSLLITEKNRYTSKKTRIISSHQQVIRYDIETKSDITADSEDSLLKSFKSIVDNYDLILLSDYGKGVLTNRLTKEIIRIANSKSIKVIVDPKGSDYTKYSNAHILTPNKKEASKATGIDIKDNDSLLKAAKKLKQDFNLDYSLITLSDDGIAILDEEFTIHPTMAKEVYDVTGAGDTVIASLSLAIANNLNIHEAINFANIAAGIVVGKVGSATASIEEINQYHSKDESIELNIFIDDFNSIKKIIDNLKTKGKSIVFTNGCFDILHAGHVQYLQEAKKLGDILVVGINSDSSTRNLKGESRPINSLEDRSILLAALRFVDYVVSFNEDTPFNLIRTLEPDILTKGGDYANQVIVGSDIVNKVVFIDFVDGKSTTNVITKIIKNERNNNI